MRVGKAALRDRIANGSGEAAVLLIVILCGLALRLPGITSSLWLDEFGTLWTVERDLQTAVRRTFEFHGQTPFYYTVSWVVVFLFGESELVLRLPSLVAVIAACYFLYRAGLELGGPPVGYVAAILLWFSPYSVRWSVEGRPYGVALMFASLMIWGFIRATLHRDRKGRLLFIVGGIGVFWCNYVFVFLGVGIFAAYTVSPSLRRNYGWRAFVTDISVQAIFASYSVPHIWALWNRRGSLELGNGHWVVVLSLVGPLMAAIVLLMIPALYARFLDVRGPSRLDQKGHLGTTFLVACVPILVIVLLNEMGGVNLLIPRYLAASLPAFALFTGVAMTQAYFVPAAPLGLAIALFLSALHFTSTFRETGAFSGAGRQDWRTAVTQLDRELTQTPGAIVLYRSGFIEDDARSTAAPVSDAVLAPLRSPGVGVTQRNLIPLTFRWQAQGRQVLESPSILRRLSRAPTIYYLSCACGTGPGSFGFDLALEKYLTHILPLRVDRLDAGRGMVLIRFTKLEQMHSRSVCTDGVRASGMSGALCGDCDQVKRQD